MNSVVRFGRDSLPQRLRRSGEQLGERQAFELAAAEKRLARGDVAVHDAAVRVREHHRERRRLDDGVEQQLALIERLAFLAQHAAEAVVAFDERGELTAASPRVMLTLKSRSERLAMPSPTARSVLATGRMK